MPSFSRGGLLWFCHSNYNCVAWAAALFWGRAECSLQRLKEGLLEFHSRDGLCERGSRVSLV